MRRESEREREGEREREKFCKQLSLSEVSGVRALGEISFVGSP
jgi:hypothetical protein